MIDTGPCGGPTLGMQVFNAVLAALNVALAAWLAQRRLRADRRENGHNGHGKPKPPRWTKRTDWDSGEEDEG